MASVNRAGGSSYTSNLYNSANIISGLASGMDTEGMIESLVQSYQTKLQNLSNKSTKIGWKQEAYRSIINKMTAFSNKYTSYTSSTNLMSSSFFNNAIKVMATGGKNAEFVTASGRTDSDVRLNSVSQLASAARYVTTSNLAGKGTGAAPAEISPAQPPSGLQPPTIPFAHHQASALSSSWKGMYSREAPVSLTGPQGRFLNRLPLDPGHGLLLLAAPFSFDCHAMVSPSQSCLVLRRAR